MMLGDSLLRRMTRVDKKDILHSCGLQNRAVMGAASSRGFADRMKMEKNRQRIRSYNDSRLASQSGFMPKPKTYEPGVKNGGFVAGADSAANTPKKPGISR